MEGNLNRRSFVKGATLSAAGLIAGGALAACSPAAGTSESKSETAQTTGANNAEQRWSFEIAPDPIGDDLITETVETDVVVVGGGMSGLVAAASCAENGLKVTLISASKAPVSRGGSNNGVYSKIMEEMGIPRMDPTWFYRKEYLANGGNFKPALWYKFYNNSEEAINWIIDIAAKAGIKTTIESGPEYKEGDPMFTPPAAHAFYVDDSELKGSIGNGEGHIAAEMGRYVAEDLGVDVRWNVKGEQLVRGGVANGTEGRVDAIIASDADGAYTKYVGTKAVIMATGDFSHDKDMMERYCPQAVELCDFTTDINYDQGIWMGGLMPGDGHKMELWVGGAWQKEPNNIMLGRPNLPGDQPYTSHTGLMVDNMGQRFMNEDVPGQNIADEHTRQPVAKDPELAKAGVKSWQIFDSKWPEQIIHMPDGHGYTTYFVPDDKIAEYETVLSGFGLGYTTQAMVDEAADVKCDTLEELAEKTGLPYDTMKAEIERYNELCHNGLDEDFGKMSKRMFPVENPPYYACKFGNAGMLVMFGGLECNHDLQVTKDGTNDPIPGLYVAGNTMGRRLQVDYPVVVAGISLATALSFGRLAGKNAAAAV